MRTLSASLLLVVVALAAISCSRGASNLSATPPADTPTAAASSSATPEVPAGTALKRVDAILEKHTYTNRAAVPADIGGGYLDIATGAFDAWTFKQPVDAGVALITPSPTGKLLFAAPSAVNHNDAPLPAYLVVRDTGVTYEFDWVRLSVVIDAAHGTTVPAWIRDGTTSELVLLDTTDGSSHKTGIAGAPSYGPVAEWSPDRATIAAIVGNELRLFDVAAMKSRTIATDMEKGMSIAVGNRNPGFQLIFPGEQIARRAYNWDGSSLPPPAANAGIVSSAGGYTATSNRIVRFQPMGMGAGPAMDATTISRAGARTPFLRIDGATPFAWLADDAGLMVQAQGGDYRIFGVDGTDRGTLPFPGLFVSPPAPSPLDSDLVMTTAGLRHLKSGDVSGPVIRADRQVFTSWTADGRSVWISFRDMPGKDGGFASQLFPAVVETPPFRDLTKIEVAADGDCVNLRTGATPTSASLGCYADRTIATLTESDDPAYNPAYDKDDAGPSRIGGTSDPTDWKAWLHVTMPDGNQGWMRADYLSWPVP